jgi:hypothetical protein
MILLVFAKPTGFGTPSINSFGGGNYSGSPTLIANTSPGGNYETWAYWVTANGNGASVSVSLSHTNSTELDVLVLAGNNTASPVAQSHTTAGTSTTATASLPSAPASGDAEIAWLGTQGNNGGITTPSGWQEVDESNSQGFGSYFTATNASQSQSFSLGSFASWVTITLDIAES